MNYTGRLLRLTTFGESHGPAMGGVIDGFPAGMKVDFNALRIEMARRRPGASANVSQRKEEDSPEFLSGLSSDGVTLGTPIGFIVRNRDCRSSDYEEMRDKYRPNHADYTYDAKYGIRDWRGGGRASARETVSRVVAGALAKQLLDKWGISVHAWLESAGGATGDGIASAIASAKENNDSIGGLVRGTVTGLPAGIGEPVYDKLQARLAAAMMGINAAKGFEYGLGFAAAEAKGSETADAMAPGPEGPSFITNHSGGIQGGISNGMPVTFAVAFKPTPTIGQPLQTVDAHGNATTIEAAGRHDPCVAVRAVPVVEAMVCLTVADLLLEHRARKDFFV